MCKPHQRWADNRFHHAGCVCRISRHASYILRWVTYLSTNRMFTPHLSTCELHPGCVCVTSVVGASSGPHQPSRLHCAMSLSPPLLSAIQDVYAASKRAAPVMRGHSFSTIQDVYAASLDMRATYCDVCSRRLHLPGCVRRTRCELHTGRVCVTCVVGASSGPRQPSRLHCAMSLSPPLLSAIQDVYAASKRAAPVMRSQSFTIQDAYAASDMRATYCDTSPPTRMCTPHRSELHTGRVCVSRILAGGIP